MAERRLPKPRTAIPAAFSRMGGARVRAHMRSWIISPRQEDISRPSEYAQKTKRVRSLLDHVPFRAWKVLEFPLIVGVRATRRNLLVYQRPDGVVQAHVVFQRHGKTMHMFHLWVMKENRGQGHGREAVLDFIEFARNKGMKSVRLGGGNDEPVNKIWKYCAEHASELRVVPRTGNWLDFPS